MTLTHYENIVKRDLENKGYDIMKTNGEGLPDFKVFNFEKKEGFYVEVKKEMNFTKKQKSIFPTLKEKIIIAKIGEGKIRYLDYKTKEILFESSYFKKEIIKPNITCPKCKHEWFTISKKVFVSCPSCLSKVRIKKLK